MESYLQSLKKKEKKDKAGFLYYRDEVQIFGFDCKLKGYPYWITILSSIWDKLRIDDDSCIPYPFYVKAGGKQDKRQHFLLNFCLNGQRARENGRQNKDCISSPFIRSGRILDWEMPVGEWTYWYNVERLKII